MSVEHRDPVAERKREGVIEALADDAELPSSPEGFEVIVPRRIKRSEIIRIKRLPQVAGWRYKPGAHGERPCVCLCCERGQYGVQKLARAVERARARGRSSKVILFYGDPDRSDCSNRRIERMRRTWLAKRLPQQADHVGG
jgi:hypothetical protein